LPSVEALGKALSNPNLKASTFVVAGHTDAAGGEGYNQDLSAGGQHGEQDDVEIMLNIKSKAAC
jgi:hypothetical protein